MVVPRPTVWKLYLKHPEIFATFRRYSLARAQSQVGILQSQTAMGFVRDMLEAGCRINSERAVNLFSGKAPRLVFDFLIDRIGTRFSKNAHGDFDYTEEAAHSDRHSIPEAVFLSTKIVVMSPRPGKIHDIIECKFPRDRTLDIRETPEFLDVANRVRQGLREGHSYVD